MRQEEKRERLLQLADFLETVDPKHFHVGMWAERKDSHQKCASTACALGWATALWPEDLTLVRSSDGENFADVLHVPTGERNVEAAVEFFGLVDEEADQLFVPFTHTGDITPTQHAEILRAFVRAFPFPQETM